MSLQLYNHLKKFIEIDETKFAEIILYFESKTLSKKEILIHAGNKCSTNYFVSSGCLHMYFITDKGVENTVRFGIENWWITDNLAFLNGQATDFYIQAVEKSEILSIDYKKQEELLAKFPELEKYFRVIYQISYGAAIMKMKYIFNYSKEDIFFHFRDHYPEFIQRIPQYLIATFLGLTPEYLSEIRKKRRS